MYFEFFSAYLTISKKVAIILLFKNEQFKNALLEELWKVSLKTYM